MKSRRCGDIPASVAATQGRFYNSLQTTGITTGIIIVFICQLCGECCGSMGEIIGIREQIGDRRFRIGFMPTGEERTVSLDPDKRDLFFMTSANSGLACPFLRELSPGTVICTVHSSRPGICRQYGCFRILFLDNNGRRVGRVLDGTRYFTSMDPTLSKIWQQECQSLQITSDEAWEEEVGRIFSQKGYHIVQ